MPNSEPRSPLPSHVLIVRLSAMGDVAMTVPVIYNVCRAYPQVKFTILTKASMHGIFVNAPGNLTVKAKDMTLYPGPYGMWRLYEEIDDECHIDAVADLHDVLRSRLIRLAARLHKARVACIDKGRSSKRRLTRRRSKVMVALPTSAQRYQTVFSRLGLDAPDTFTSVFGDKPGPSHLFSPICDPKAKGEVWVGIAPFAAHQGKIYPPERMAIVADTLYNKGVRLFFFGGGDTERQTLSEWTKRWPGSISLAEKRYGFTAELALQSHLDAMVTMDSGNMHLASLVGIPTVTVWGATHPYCGFTARGQRQELTVQADMDCRPCSVFGNKPCHYGDYRCMLAITPREIIDKVMRLLPAPADDTPTDTNR